MMTRTGERIGAFGGSVDRFLANTERKVRAVETMAVITVPRVSIFAMLVTMELALTAWMTHPVIIPSPVGMECSEALRKGCSKVMEWWQAASPRCLRKVKIPGSQLK